MRNRVAVLAALALATLAALASAAVFAYRSIQGTINMQPVTSASGAACVGFYSSATWNEVDLPAAGTNYNAETYGSNGISVNTGSVVCEWTYNGETHDLFDSISVTIPLTPGTWYIKDFYGLGYHGDSNSPQVTVHLKVKKPIDSTDVSSATLHLYDATDGSLVASLDLKSSSSTSFTLSGGEAVQLDLEITVGQVSGTSMADFTIGIYVTQGSESPR